MKKFVNLKVSLVLLGSILIFASPATALAAKPASRSGGGSHGGGGTSTTSIVTGNDVSWPQCSKSLPKGQLFGIVGVNGGLANTTNPCFATELAWAEASVGGAGQGKAALYVNTANPGNLGVDDWPTTGTLDQYGTCAGGDDQACAYQYGWNMAELDAQTRIGSNNPASFKWWLDVETDNSWETGSTGIANNVADLEGMTDYFHGVGAKVGLYSTALQWNQIAGTVSTASSLYGLDSWLPGSSNLTGAENACALPGLTGGQTTVTQYVAKRVDYDYSCV
ncbi:MAG TPA: hypothetical protein VF261_00210 [Candidatus Saccharimonadales bacterium]